MAIGKAPWLTWFGVAAWLAFALVAWAVAPPLGHDESQYAIAAREALAGEPPRWFYLSRGMEVVAAPGILLGASEHALRALPLLIGIGLVVAAFVLGRRTVGALSAAWALLVLAGSRNVVRWSTDLLSDIPATFCLVAALAVLVDEVDREDGPRWRVMLAAPFLAGALHVRYGSAVPIAVIVGAALLVGGRTLLRRPWPVLATAALFLVLLVPHFVHAIDKTGSPLGILLASRSVPQQAYFGAGLVDYLTNNPFKMYGTLTPFVMLAGLAALRVRSKRRLLVWLVGVGSLVAIGLTTHAQTRYVLLPITIFVVLGTDEIRHWLSVLPPRIGRVLGAAAAGALVAVWLLLVVKQHRADDNRSFRMRATFIAAAAIRADAAGRPCTVLGYHYTQLEWYSGCTAPLVMDAASAASARAAGKRVYAVRDYTPSWAPMNQLVFSELPGTPHFVVQRPEIVEVVRLESLP